MILMVSLPQEENHLSRDLPECKYHWYPKFHERSCLLNSTVRFGLLRGSFENKDEFWVHDEPFCFNFATLTCVLFISYCNSWSFPISTSLSTPKNWHQMITRENTLTIILRIASMKFRAVKTRDPSMSLIGGISCHRGTYACLFNCKLVENKWTPHISNFESNSKRLTNIYTSGIER